MANVPPPQAAPPPPPPSHGQQPKSANTSSTSSSSSSSSSSYSSASSASGSSGKANYPNGLPPGNYDIFIIPPHSSGSGFLYLPSLAVQRNSFIAGIVCSSVFWMGLMMISPIIRYIWHQWIFRGHMGFLILLGISGLISWIARKSSIGAQAGSKDPGVKSGTTESAKKEGPSYEHAGRGSRTPGTADQEQTGPKQPASPKAEPARKDPWTRPSPPPEGNNKPSGKMPERPRRVWEPMGDTTDPRNRPGGPSGASAMPGASPTTKVDMDEEARQAERSRALAAAEKLKWEQIRARQREEALAKLASAEAKHQQQLRQQQRQSNREEAQENREKRESRRKPAEEGSNSGEGPAGRRHEQPSRGPGYEHHEYVHGNGNGFKHKPYGHASADRLDDSETGSRGSRTPRSSRDAANVDGGEVGGGSPNVFWGAESPTSQARQEWEENRRQEKEILLRRARAKLEAAQKIKKAAESAASGVGGGVSAPVTPSPRRKPAKAY